MARSKKPIHFEPQTGNDAFERLEFFARQFAQGLYNCLVFVGPQTVWGWVGLVPLATAVLGWCPPYALLGINTCAVKTPTGGAKT